MPRTIEFAVTPQQKTFRNDAPKKLERASITFDSDPTTHKPFARITNRSGEVLRLDQDALVGLALVLRDEFLIDYKGANA